MNENEDLNMTNIQLLIREYNKADQVEKYMKLLINTFYKRRFDKITIIDLHKVKFRMNDHDVSVIHNFNLISITDKIRYINFFLKPLNQIPLNQRGKFIVSPYEKTHLQT